jgi:4-aminobutyrate aminotransferase-like enzyme
LTRLEKEGRINNLRGYGTFIGFDVQDANIANKMQDFFEYTGIKIDRVGVQTFGLRPSLLLRPHHAKYLREAILYFSPHMQLNTA